jgi:hypothetical protein
MWQLKTGSPVVEADQVGSFAFEETFTGSIRWLSGEYGLYGVLGLTIAAARPLAQRRILFWIFLGISAGALDERARVRSSK